ncbi:MULTISPECIES: S53 family peptidase [Caballeronia]|uniref:Peptidase S53 n=1 Tax=Caballeronia zhejiangensis TaxID=871203 RepID=A0A656QSK3_9BURK|nr:MULTISPECIES: S53 family peptidase [Caballeronia]EKS71306.1 peptidase S53 propeptide [Burkholderia sp. SJ98]KDR32075.1 peptidase S53 [Caballeronia zhejiangensis]MDR5769334.1 S53 family peptidase [Caballeronia sp. LZ028]MDR5790254.1 S53 family peptidase [Caballeronia sp. LP003]MDR5798417.1 S53 family peptidase [Caballeronia sp. LZ008]
MANHPLNGSERECLKDAQPIGKADPNERLEVTMLVRRRSHDAFEKHISALAAQGASAKHIDHDEFTKHFGADSADLAAVHAFAQKHGLSVVESHEARRAVVLSGTVAQFDAAFGVSLQQYEHDGGTYRGRTGPIHLPDELNGVVDAVMGLDNRPQARPSFRTRAQGNVRWTARAAGASTFTPVQLASLYDFPQGDGQNQCIGIIELGGGYRPADLKTYFASLNMKAPSVTAVSVDHGRNHPTGDPNGPDGEVMLDIEVAGAVAPGAKIVVYFAPNTDAGFIDAIGTAIHDTKNKPSVISISWGGPESAWTQQAMNAFDQAFQSAAALGVTICAASGDNGSGDGVGDGADHVDFPASSPYALGCGGTSLQASGNGIASETVWNDGANGGATGGGVSSFFALPAWQEGLRVTRAGGAHSPLAMRGVPDVAGNADPVTGYEVRVDGHDMVIGGTSAVAPLWAGLIARINAIKGAPVGYINPHLYKDPLALVDITKGNNDDFHATAGWDACTGLGRPDGKKVKDAVS